MTDYHNHWSDNQMEEQSGCYMLEVHYLVVQVRVGELQVEAENLEVE